MRLEKKLKVPTYTSLSQSAPLKFKQLLSDSPYDFFRNIDKLINELIECDPEMDKWCKVMGDEKEKLLKGSLIDQDFSKISDDSDEYEVAIYILSLKNKLRHRIIKKYLKGRNAKKNLFLLLVSNIRFLTIRAETTLQPYFMGALMEFKIMIDSGFLCQDDAGKIKIDMSKVDNFYTGLKQAFNTMVTAYITHYGELAKKLLDENAITTPIVEEMYKLAMSVS